MLSIEELEEVFVEIRTGESDGSLFIYKGDSDDRNQISSISNTHIANVLDRSS